MTNSFDGALLSLQISATTKSRTSLISPLYFLVVLVPYRADLGLKLDEPRTRSVVEQMLSMFQNQFVPKDGSTASVPMDPVEIGDEYKRRVDEVQSQLKSLQEQIIAVDTAVEKQVGHPVPQAGLGAFVYI